MDTLGELSGSGSDSDKEAEAPEEHAVVKPAKRQKPAAAVTDPAPEELESLGYKSGPSVLFVPEPQSEATPSWDWYGFLGSAHAFSLACNTLSSSGQYRPLCAYRRRVGCACTALTCNGSYLPSMACQACRLVVGKPCRQTADQIGNTLCCHQEQGGEGATRGGGKLC